MDNFKVILLNDYEVELRYINEEFIIEMGFENKIIENNFFSGLSDVKHLKIKVSNDALNVERMFQYLNVCYLYFGFIPKYNFKSKFDPIFRFEIIVGLINRIDIKSFSLSLSNCHSIDSDSYIFELNSMTPEYFLNILQTNTKARRLGYLKLIISLFKESNYFPINYLNKKIELASSDFSNDLDEYGVTDFGNNKGLIKLTSSGISAKPYTDLLEELNLVTRVNNTYVLTKQAKVYFAFQSNIGDLRSINSNLFFLNEIDRLFFLRQIFLSDSLYIIVLLDIIKITGQVSIKTIKEVFQLYLLDEMERLQHSSNDFSFIRKVSDIRKRIRSWLKPQVYLEHIVEPRINWLLDLNLVIQDKKSSITEYSLSIYGERFLSIISSTLEVGENREVYSRKIVNNHFFGIFDSVYHSSGLCFFQILF